MILYTFKFKKKTHLENGKGWKMSGVVKGGKWRSIGGGENKGYGLRVLKHDS